MKVTPSDACKDNEDITFGDETKNQLYTGIAITFFLFLNWLMQQHLEDIAICLCNNLAIYKQHFSQFIKNVYDLVKLCIHTDSKPL